LATSALANGHRHRSSRQSTLGEGGQDIFVRKYMLKTNAQILHDNCLKNIFPDFLWGARASPSPMPVFWQILLAYISMPMTFHLFLATCFSKQIRKDVTTHEPEDMYQCSCQ